MSVSTLNGLETYLSALASSAGTPGGGAAAAVSGAQAAALLSMVCELTRGDRFSAVAEEVAALNQSCHQRRSRMLALAEADMQAFEGVMAAWRRPKAERQAALQPALAAAAEPALDMMALAVDMLPAAARLATVGNPNLITDVGAAALQIDACVRCARLNVLVNAQAIKDAKLADALKDRMAQSMHLLESELPPVVRTVEARLMGR